MFEKGSLQYCRLANEKEVSKPETQLKNPLSDLYTISDKF